MNILYEHPMVLTPQIMSARTFRQPEIEHRTKGIHVQAINKSLGIAAGKLSNSDGDDFPFDRFTDTNYPLMPALGVAWEEFRASHYSELELIWQPGELCLDNIYGTPDGLLEPWDTLWECKQTTKKLQTIADCWMYLKQGMSYCAMSGHRKVKYDVCWLLGDYQRPYQACGTESLIEFTDMEVETWWKIVRKAAQNVEPER